MHTEKVGRAVSTTLVSCKRPASLRKEDILIILLSHLETKGQKFANVGFDRLNGSPKYVKGRDPTAEAKVFAKMFR